ncbi:MAG TPA: NAD-dependent epimerase/dehydratase family protein [Flavitalea sp.]|nr:NAD-dependent epimerase/dehydratase family protein [Flavitalea sp.]
MKVFITGATGYLGNRLAHSLAEQGNQVHALVRNKSAAKNVHHQNITLFEGDVLLRDTITPAIMGCTHAYHTAAMVKLCSRKPGALYSVNVDGTNNVLGEAYEQGVRKVVCTSSCGVLGNSVKEPMRETDPRISSFDNDYELSKSMAEKVASDYASKGLFVTIVRPSKIFGPGPETHPISVNQIIKLFLERKVAFMPSPASVLANYCFIDDVVKGCQRAISHGVSGEKYILGGENVSYYDFFQRLRSITGIKGILVPAPRYLVQGVAVAVKIASQFSSNDPFITAKGVKHLYANKAYSSNRAICQLGYQITSLNEGLEKTVQFLKSNNYAS